ncbi:FGGY-family carbohydrate kinase [Thiofaba sp. EF100]|uniref:FGGY-family carbohydrate kinase n=1 Tax=Thiofaba sp. EF100 TaxID=3121274 RepID=UPI0032215EB9
MAQVVGIDFGTSGVRACVLDAGGRSVAEAAVPLPAPLQTADGGWEQDPEQWWTALCALLGELARRIDLGALRALAIDGTSGTLVACSQEGRPLHPALMYHDARARDEAARIAAVAPRESGGHGATASLAKLLWLKGRGLPGSARLLHQAEWVAGRLLGRFDLGDENNLLKMGYDVLERRWPDWLGALGVDPGCLPLAHAPGTPLGRVDPGMAGMLGLSSALVIVAGTTDSIAATLASGGSRVGDAVTTLGTTLALKVFSDRPVFAPEYGVYSHRLGDVWLAGGASNSGGAVLRQYFDEARLEVLSARIDPRQDSGLDYYPLPAPGERFPVADPALAPRLAPRPEDDARFLHGLLEGMARIELEGYRRLHELGAPWPARVLSMGGGARNPVWTALRARLLGVPVESCPDAIPACGAARLALKGLSA